MSKSATTTELERAGLSTRRRPTTPGEVIKEEFLRPMNLTQTRLARALGIPLQRLNMIIKGKRAVTPDTALRLSKALGCSVKFWLNLQQDVDLYNAIVSAADSDIGRIQRLDTSAAAVAG